MWGKREIIHLSLHCHHQNDSCIKIGSDESHFNVLLVVSDKVTREYSRTHGALPFPVLGEAGPLRLSNRPFSCDDPLCALSRTNHQYDWSDKRGQPIRYIFRTPYTRRTRIAQRLTGHLNRLKVYPGSGPVCPPSSPQPPPTHGRKGLSDFCVATKRVGRRGR